MSDLPRTDAFVAYMARQFPATVGHIPMRQMVAALEEDLNEANQMIADADEDCARHNLYTVEESLRAAKAIAEANGEDPKTTFASWHDRIWWLEAQKEIARLREALGEPKP